MIKERSGEVKIVFLNLPNKFRVIRRFMCSYNAPNFLFPPLELMYLSALAEKKNIKAELIDAIAQGLDADATLDKLKNSKPDMVLFMTGFEIFGEDMSVADFLKDKMPDTRFVAIGYYPSIFPKEVLDNSKIDAVIMGEPEMTFSCLCERLSANSGLDGVDGLAFRQGPHVVTNKARGRIEDLDSLPFPSRNLINNDLYSEPFLGRPFTTILASRGCPYTCAYCVRTYGNKLVCRSAENILVEIREVVCRFGIRNFRFLDDTFTVRKKRVIQICESMLKEGIKANWTALSRIDTLDRDTLEIMKKAGCRRLYVGIESGSQKVLDYYKKGYKADQIIENIDLINSSGIKTAGFFMVGAPVETEEDFNKTMTLAKECKLDYCTIFRTMPYPGTCFFDDMKERIEFSLFPYKNRLKDAEFEKRINDWEGRFFKEYYLRFGYIVSKAGFFIRHPLQLLYAGLYFFKHLFCRKERPRGDFI